MYYNEMEISLYYIGYVHTLGYALGNFVCNIMKYDISK